MVEQPLADLAALHLHPRVRADGFKITVRVLRNIPAAQLEA
jgi:hypothetical protein